MMLVAGATGTLGGMIARQLLARGERVRVLVRPGSDYRALADAGAEAVLGDVKDASSLTEAFRGITHVVTTVNSAMRGGEDTVESVDLSGNRNLIDAAAAAGVAQFVFVAALGASPESPVPFLRAKGETESYLRASGLPATIVEPNIFMEEWVGMIVGMPLQSNQPVTIVGEGKRRHSFISRRDVAAFVTAAAGNAAAHGRMLVLGGPEPLSWLDVVAVFERVLGRPIPVRHIGPGESLPGLPEVVSQLAAGMDTYDSPIEMAETAREFGVQLTSVEAVARQLLSAPA